MGLSLGKITCVGLTVQKYEPVSPKVDEILVKQPLVLEVDWTETRHTTYNYNYQYNQTPQSSILGGLLWLLLFFFFLLFLLFYMNLFWMNKGSINNYVSMVIPKIAVSQWHLFDLLSLRTFLCRQWVIDIRSQIQRTGRRFNDPIQTNPKPIYTRVKVDGTVRMYWFIYKPCTSGTVPCTLTTGKWIWDVCTLGKWEASMSKRDWWNITL